MVSSSKSPDFVKSVAKALAVLRIMNERQTPLTISEIAADVGISRASARRLLVTLEELGFLRLSGRHFALTPRVLELSRAFQVNDPFWGIAQPLLEELALETGETASTGVLDDLEVVYIMRAKPPRSLHLNLSPGTRLPAHISSMGRVLLANAHPRQIETYFRRAKIERYTETTLTDPAEIKEQLTLARENGYAIVNGEMDENIIGIGVPVFDRGGNAVAALNLSISKARVTIDEAKSKLLPRILKTAEILGKQISAPHHSSAGPRYSPPLIEGLSSPD